MRTLFAIAAVGLGIAMANPANASENLPASLAQKLDKQAAEYTWSAAAERRHMIMRETMRQQRYGRGGYGYGPRHGYGPRYGHGPRYGYGPRPGYYRPYRGW